MLRTLSIVFIVVSFYSCGSDETPPPVVPDPPPTPPHDLTIPSSGATSPETYDGMNLVWSDEFDAISADNWTFQLGNGVNGWGNNEAQFYKEENATIVDGNLVIEAREEIAGGSFKAYPKRKKDYLNNG